VSDFPWWDEVSSNAALMQGDLIDRCPVTVFKEDLPWDGAQDLDSLLKSLSVAAGIQFVRSIIMTQACDLEQQKVRNVILCPAYLLTDFRALWEAAEQAKTGSLPKPKEWDSHVKGIKAGRVWNLAMLMKREPGDGVTLTTPTTVVDFHEVFSVPVGFLTLWVQKTNQPRLRLLPPYREHLSQGFARFFMRVGLPVDITEL
jgi:hypothetical protein